MKVIITGGHFSPAHSVLKELIKTKHKVLIAGRRTSFEGENTPSYEYVVSQKEKIPFYEIRAGRLQRYINKLTFTLFFKLFVGIYDAIKILLKFKPDIVLTFGGYISLPVALAAFILRVPIIIHEQTQKAGLANRIVGLFAQKVCITFPSSFKYFPKEKTVLTGNPVRKEIFEIMKPLKIDLDRKVIYITGGSAGSHFINSLILQTLPQLLEKYIVIHQVGDSQQFGDYDSLKKKQLSLPLELQKRYVLQKFILPEEIGWILKNSSIIISRAGINTVIELILLGKPAFLIPLPHGQSKEQLENAKLFKSIGVGEYAHQQTLTGKLLLENVNFMAKNEKNYLKITNFSKGYLKKDGTKNIIDILESIYEKKKKKKS